MDGVTVQTMGYLLPEIILAAAGCVIMLVYSYTKNRTLAFILAIDSLLAAMFAAVLLLGKDVTIIFGTVEINTFAVLLKIIFIFLSILVVWASWNFAPNIQYAGEYYVFILFATLGMTLLASAQDLLTLFVAFELTSISTYTLPLIDHRNEQGREAAVKYFITGSFSSALVLFGLSILFGLTGTLHLKSLAVALSQYGGEPLLFAACMLVIAGFGYKMTIAPFHLWAPDVYEGSPTPVTAFLAAATKKGAFVVGFKVFLVALVAIKLQVSIVLAALAVLTMTLGNVAALLQQDTKRMLAYSSVAHAGNILVGLAVYSQLAVAGSILHIVAHGIMTVGIFFGLFFVAGQRGGYDLAGFAGLRKTAPLTAFGLLLILLSLAGIPPFLGFWSKMVLVLSAFEAGGWYVLLALILVLNSALSLVYYARIARVMYMDSEPEALKVQEKGSYVAVLYACAILLTLVGFFPDQLVAISNEAARFIIP